MSLELGGKNAALVFADCDFDKAIEGIARSVFANCGQVCLGTERVYVERPIFEKFVGALKAKAEALKIGRAGRRRTPRWAADQPGASQQGAVLLRQGQWTKAPTWSPAAACPSMPERAGERLLGAADDLDRPAGDCGGHAARRSSGPAATSRRSTAKTKPCAGQRHRLWPGDLDLDRESQRAPIASRRRSTSASAGSTAGSCAICAPPFGGSKQSGIGREGGVHSLEFYTELRNVCIKL